RSIDARAIKQIGIPGSTLMERAGLETVDYMADLFEFLAGRRIMVFCGKGNNGGDGYVIARELKRLAADVRVYVFGKKTDISGDALVNYSIIQKMGLKIEHINSDAALSKIPDSADIVVDALLGTGIKGEVRGILGKAISKINSINAAVVAVDLPSGLNSDTGTFENECVRADLTVTMGLLKTGLLLYPGKIMTGLIRIADIGFPEKAISPTKVRTFLIDETDINLFFPERQPYYYKGDCGRVLVIGGSPGLTGATALTCNSALRSGAGMTLLGIPQSLNPILEQKLTETMTVALPETEDGCLSLEAEEKIFDVMPWADVLAIGPGIGRNEETIKLVLNLLSKAELPIVLDADGLYALSKKPGILKKREFETIITPHQGEFCRMISKEDIPCLETDRLETLRKYAKKFKCTILLKGAPTLIAGDTGDVYINPTGNAGMASAGSGDVLTGIIAGLMGQGMDVTTAGITGAYIHGLSGDLASEELGEAGMIAGDLVDFLPYATEVIIGEHEHEHDEE
ncbi:NAD(P)H-hydrate dehydratase, partial [candidate division KSB1 bacterium]